MKIYRIFAAFIFLSALPVFAQFQPGDTIQQYPECRDNSDCFFEKKTGNKMMNSDEIERQEEDFEEFEDADTENKRVEELKKNAEQPGLN